MDVEGAGTVVAPFPAVLTVKAGFQLPDRTPMDFPRYSWLGWGGLKDRTIANS